MELKPLRSTAAALAAALCLLGTGTAFGQGYQVNLMGQKQTAMGHTGTGFLQDGAALYFNPGAVSHLEGNIIQAGVSFVDVQSAYVDKTVSAPTYETQNPVKPPPTLYAVWGPEASKFKFGLGVYAPFGGAYDWGSSWVGRYALKSLSLQAIYFQPTVSYKLSDKLGVGVGFIYALGAVDLQRALPFSSAGLQDGLLQLKSNSATGVGYNIGVYYKPSDKLSFGIAYRSLVRAKVTNGDAVFTVPGAVAPLFANSKSFNAELPLPAQLSVGMAFKPTEKLTLALDYNYIFWDVYQSLDIDIEQNSSAVADSKQPRSYKNSMTFRLGGQYQVTEKLAVRAGGYYGIAPVQDGYVTPESPDGSRYALTAGFGYQFSEKFSLDASFEYLRVFDREDNNHDTGLNGTWATSAVVPGIGFNYKF